VRRYIRSGLEHLASEGTGASTYEGESHSLGTLPRIWIDVFKDVGLGQDCWQEYEEKNQGARGSSHVCMIVVARVARGR
jgi:hypothetical protein